MTLKVGLTGGIGSGKSTVAEMLRARGVPIVDLDAIAHALCAPGEPGHRAIVQAFGPEVLAPDGRLDRARLRRRVFSDPEARAKLEAALHPSIRAEAERQLAGVTGPYVVLVIPLLAEKPEWRDLLDRVVVVDCPEAVRIARVMRRNGMSMEEVRAILAAQASRAARLALADAVIDNSGSREDLERQVEALDRRLRGAARDRD